MLASIVRLRLSPYTFHLTTTHMISHGLVYDGDAISGDIVARLSGIECEIAKNEVRNYAY